MKRSGATPKRPILAVSCLLLAACANTPPAAPTPVPEAGIGASFGRAWDAVIDHFAFLSVPIRTLERASGIIVTDPLSIANTAAKDKARADSLASCGGIMGTDISPDRVSYNVRVVGDSTRSTVRVTAIFWWGTTTSAQAYSCNTKGKLEQEIQAAVKQKAEAPKN